jgi:hypothetical protein
MMNYKKIDELFGAPLNQVPRPHKPFQIKPWHVAAGLVVGIFIYKGFQKFKEDLSKNKNQLFMPLKLKDEIVKK